MIGDQRKEVLGRDKEMKMRDRRDKKHEKFGCTGRQRDHEIIKRIFVKDLNQDLETMNNNTSYLL